MRFLEIAILIGLIAWGVLAVRSLKKKGACGCGGNCADCGCCTGCAKAGSCRDCEEEKRGS